MHKKGQIAASCTKDTFWSNLRIAKKVTLKEMAEEFGIDKTTLCCYLTGSRLPATSLAMKICDYFDVDYVKGAEEFNKAHERWVASNPGKKKKRSQIRRRKFDTTKSEKPKASSGLVEFSAEVVPNPTTGLTHRDIAKKIYGIISYDDFMDYSNKKCSIHDILRKVYNNVSFDDFYELLTATGVLDN